MSSYKKFPSTGYKFYFSFKNTTCFDTENFPRRELAILYTLSHGFALTGESAPSGSY